MGGGQTRRKIGISLRVFAPLFMSFMRCLFFSHGRRKQIFI